MNNSPAPEPTRSLHLAAGLALLGGTVGGLLASRAVRNRRAISFRDKTIVIVGGSRGLGLAIARVFAREGARLVLVARDHDELEKAANDLDRYYGVKTRIVTCDVRDRDQTLAMINWVVSELGTLDVLVNDAGIIEVGPLDHMTLADFENAMATHFWGPLTTTLAALPHMRRQGAKRIVNIASVGGKVAVPHLLPYCSSKFALTGLSEGLRAELAREGFAVTTVCPGLTRTGSSYNATFKGQYRREFAWFHTSSALPGVSMSAERTAGQIVDACRHGDAQLVTTLAAKVLIAMNGFAPAFAAAALSFANRLLPRATGRVNALPHSGWNSTSRLAPSMLTRLSDHAAVENNEVRSGYTPASAAPAE
jgi:NAD(P)-dependent dehydrogenase (short-subunit alcohol dehydrogenase family)